MGNAEAVGHVARVIDILARTACTLAFDCGAVIVELQGNTDSVEPRRSNQRCSDAAVDAARHSDDDTRFFRGLVEP